MKLELFVEDAFTIGDFQPPNIVVTFNSQEDKRLLFQNIKQLKKVVNQDGKSYGIKDFLPASINEKRMHNRRIIEDNNKKPPGLKLEMETGKGGLYVKKKLFVKRIQTPDPTVVLNMPVKEVESILKKPISRAPETVKKDGNTFLGYSVCSNNFMEVQNAYLHVKLHHPGARHIVCAYRLPGLPDHEYNNYCDGDETGMGNAILSWMEENQITHRAIFLIQYCGEKLGSDRYLLYKQIAAHAVNTLPINAYPL